jgi:hypothetical protein
VKHLKLLPKMVEIVYIMELWPKCLSPIFKKWVESSQKKTWLITGINYLLHGAFFFEKLIFNQLVNTFLLLCSEIVHNHVYESLPLEPILS